MLTKTAKWVITQSLLLEIIVELENLFNKIGVDIMPIKGAYLIRSGLGDRMRTRKITDIDILVKPKDLEVTTDALSKISNCKLIKHYKDNSRPTESIFEYSLNDFKFTVEIMSIINSEDRFLLPAEKLFDRGELQGKTLYFPSSEDALLIMICHLQSHIPFEFRDTNFDEIKVFTEVEDFNWDNFWKYANYTGMGAFNYFILKLYNRETNSNIKFSKRYIYSDLLLRFFTLKRYYKMSELMRRLFLDLPFVRKPIRLVKRKILA